MAKNKAPIPDPSPNFDEHEIRGRETRETDEFTVGAWCGRAHYQCHLCRFDCWDKQAMLNHLVDAHNSEAALEQLVMTEPAAPIPAFPQKDGEVFEVELVETDSVVDEDGNVHKNYVIKEDQ